MNVIPFSDASDPLADLLPALPPSAAAGDSLELISPEKDLESSLLSPSASDELEPSEERQLGGVNFIQIDETTTLSVTSTITSFR